VNLLRFTGQQVKSYKKEEENRRLQKELNDIRQERDIFKKALAIY